MQAYWSYYVGPEKLLLSGKLLQIRLSAIGCTRIPENNSGVFGFLRVQRLGAGHGTQTNIRASTEQMQPFAEIV
jgi:hypothetical protein